MQNTNFKALEPMYKRLLESAEKAAQTAYNPYSGYYVGASILTKSEQIITGSNVENVSYGLSICAEQSAVVRANAMNEQCFHAIAIISKNNNKEPITPCGKCRQILYEMSKACSVDFDVIMSNTKKDNIVIAKISELLPIPFTL